MNRFSELIKSKVITRNIQPKPDSIVEGIITNRIHKKNGDEYFLVNVGLKSDGIVPIKDFGDNVPKINDKVKLIVEKQDNIRNEFDGKILLSHSRLKKKELQEYLKNIYEKSKTLEVTVEMELENGYKVHVIEDIFGFLPQEDCVKQENNQETQVKFSKGDVIPEAYISRFSKSHSNRIQLSLRKLRNVFVNDVVNCTIKEINENFISVYIQNCNIKEGIIHVSDLDYVTLNSVQSKSLEELQSQTIKAKIIRIDDHNNGFLSIKKLMHEQWEKSAYAIDQEVECSVVQINEVGIIVLLPDGLEGFIHSFEVTWNTNNLNLQEMFKVGQKIKAKIVAMDRQKKQLKLSIKQLQENISQNPFNQFIKNHKVGDIIPEALVLSNSKNYDHLTFAFLFVQLCPGVDGRLTPRDMDWNEQRGKDAFNTLQPGQKIKVQITNIDESNQRVSVSVKSMNADNFDNTLKNIQTGHIYDCEVIQTGYDGLKVNVLITPKEEKQEVIEGVILKNDISRDKTVTYRSFSKGDVVKAKFIRIDKESRALILSIKAMENDIQKNAIKTYCGDEHQGNSLLDFLE